jgi:hypothetical protein
MNDLALKMLLNDRAKYIMLISGLSCVIAGTQPGEDPAVLAKRIGQVTGLKAYTEKQFFWLTVWW